MNCCILTWHSYYERTKGETDKLVDRQTILDTLDTMPEVRFWRASTGAIFIGTETAVRTLAPKIHAKLPKLLFVLALIRNEDADGWTDRRTWEVISNPTHGLSA